MKKLMLFSMLLIISFTTVHAEVSPGEVLYKDKKINCAQCHGPKGMGMAKKDSKGKWSLKLMKGPRIAGLPVEDIETALVQIQDADRKKLRKTKASSMMKSRIKKLDEKEIKDLAIYVNKLLNPEAGSYKSEIWPR